MGLQLPADIVASEEVGEQGRTTIYRLPANLTTARPFVALWIIVAFVLYAIPFVFGALAYSFSRHGRVFGPEIALFPICFFGLFLFPLGTLLLMLGLFARWGWYEITLLPQQLKARARLGPLRWTRIVPLAALRGFRVKHGTASASEESEEERAIDRLATLLADCHGGGNVTICWGYAPAWLEQFAAVLTQRCAANLGGKTELPPVTADEQHPGRIRKRSLQPSHSSALVEVSPGRFKVTLPPRGLIRGNNPILLAFGVLWNLMTLPFALIFVPLLLLGQVQWEDGPEKAPPWMALIVVPHVLVGLGFLAYLRHNALRAAVLEVNQGTLSATTGGLWGNQVHCWPLSEIGDVLVTSRRTQSDDSAKWSWWLSIDPKQGSTVSLLHDSDQAELEWIATALREAIGLKHTTNI